MPEAEAPASPFSLFLAETESRPARTHHDSRNQSAPSTPRSEPTSAARPNRPGKDRNTDAPEPEATEAAPNEEEQAKSVQANQPQSAAAPETPDAVPVVTDGDSEAPSDEPPPSNEVVATDPALAAPAEVPLPPVPEQPVVADPLTIEAAPTPEAPPPVAEVPSEPGMEPPAAAPTGEVAAVAPDAPVAPTQPAPTPATSSPQADQPLEHAPHEGAMPATPKIKPAVASAVTTERADPLAQPTTDDVAAAPTGAANSAEQAETKPAPHHPMQAGSSHAAPRPQGPEPTERPQTANVVSESVHTTHPAADSSTLVQPQTGRDFGQAVAATAQAKSADTSNPLVSSPVPLESLAVEIASRAQGGRNRFEIRLDPPELGRIEVRLDIDRSGHVTSRLVVEKAETLDVLRRDAHQLERALQDAGLKTSDNSLEFSLRDQAFAGRQDQHGSERQHVRIADPELPATESAAVAYGLTLRGGSGVDIRV